MKRLATVLALLGGLYALPALAAYAAGKTVRFQGTCDSQAGYFDATYLTVSG